MYTYDPSVFRKVFERNFVYIKGFLRNVDRFGKRSALICPVRDKTWSYVELNKECNRLANALMEAGVGKGDVVTYMLPNIPEFVFFYLAPQKIGAINNPINYRLAPGEVAYILDACKPKVFAYDAAFSETVAKALKMADEKPDVVVRVILNSEAKEEVPGEVLFDEFLSSNTSEPFNVDDIPSSAFEEVTRLHTSGTTGLPKLVPINNVNEIMSAHDVIMHYPLSPLDRTMNLTPWFHRGGLYSGGPNPTLYIGGTVVSLRTFDPNLALNYIEKYKVTFITGAPTTAKMLLEEQMKNPRDLSSLKGVCMMGSPLDRQLCLEIMEKLSPNVMNGYGTTETFWNTFLRPFDLPDKAGTAGRSCTDDDVRVIRIKDEPDPEDTVARNNEEVGEVIIRTPKFAYTYLDPKYNEGRIRGEWYFTHDLATWDEDGYLTIVGRKDDMFISGGENIYPVQVEEALLQHPKVRDVAVVGVSDETWGQLCTAYVVPASPVDDEVKFAKELDDFCKNHPMLSRFKRPRYYRFVSELPITATGKKKHFEVRKMAEDDRKSGRLIRV